MKLYITGHDGFIGSQLIQVLEKEGHELILCDQDIREFKYTGEKPDMILHVAALVSVKNSVKNPELYHDVNVNGSRKIFHWAITWDIPIIYWSSSNAAEWWTNPYAITKRMVEEIAPQRSIGIRPFNVYPGRDDMLLKRLERNDVKYINGKHKRDWIHIDDFCEGVCRLIERYYEFEGQVIDFGSGKSMSVLEVAESRGFKGEVRFDPTPLEREVTQADSTIIEDLLKRELQSPVF